jgi:tRNA (mo5U34)-methyltransferase
MSELLSVVKRQQWFYEFELPDGSRTESYIPEYARAVHPTRVRALRSYLEGLKGECSSALDISCHEGFFSHVLSEYLPAVTGIDKNEPTLVKARQITTLLERTNIRFRNVALESLGAEDAADFVLCYGLLYHVENPIEIFRALSRVTKKALCIETQVLPFQIAGNVEDGSYQWQRGLQGTFGMCVDYSERPEGGMTNIALIPSLDALRFLLNQFGFSSVSLFKPEPSDYEQFTRGHRVILLAKRG